MSRKILLVILGCLILGTSPLFALSSATVNVRVTCVAGLSVAVSGDYQFGTIGIDATTVSTVGITVTNDSTQATESYKLNAANSASWSLSGTADPSENLFTLAAVIRATADVQPTQANFVMTEDTLTLTATYCTADYYSVNADPASSKGISVTTSGTRNIWFRLEAPKTVTLGSGTEQVIPVTVTAAFPQ